MPSYIPYPTGFKRRKIITPQVTNLGSALTDFPLLVKFSSDAAIGRWGHASGTNLRFTNAAGTLLKYQRLAHSVSSGLATGIYYVKHSLDPAGDNRIQVAYDNPGAADGQDAANTWTNHAVVLNLEENPGGTAPQMLDSTGNNRHATSEGSMTSGNLVSAHAGNGIELDGVNDALTFTPFTIPLSGSLSVVWTPKDTFTTENRPIFRVRTLTPALRLFDFGFYAGSIVSGWYNNANDDRVSVTAPTHTINVPHLLTATWANGGDTKLYFDDSLLGTVPSLDSTWDTAGGDLQFAIGKATNLSAFSPCILDGFRIASVVDSAAAVKFRKFNTFEADNELTWGSEEVMSAGGMMGV